jgi:phosphate transport system permease protein
MNGISVPASGVAVEGAVQPLKDTLGRRRFVQRLAFGLMWLFGGLAVALLAWIVGYVLLHGVSQLDLAFLTTRPQGGLEGKGGMSTTIVTTLYLVALTVVIATPLGVGAAIYLIEYAGELQKESRLIAALIRVARAGVELLAGVPSIVFGLFGFALFVSYLNFNFSLLSAGLSGACLILPVIIRTTEEALLAVPQSYREASLGLGATKWQTVVGVVLPTAMPGIVTGIVLSVGRIVSETAIFWVTLGGSFLLPDNLLAGGRTMALHVFMLATETRAFDKAMATSAVLIAIIVVINLTITYTSRQLTARVEGRK